MGLSENGVQKLVAFRLIMGIIVYLGGTTIYEQNNICTQTDTHTQNRTHNMFTGAELGFLTG